MRTTTEKNFSDSLILLDWEIPFDLMSLLDSDDASGLEDLFDLETSELHLGIEATIPQNQSR